MSHGNAHGKFPYENDSIRQNDVRQSFETFANEFNRRLSQEMDSMMSMVQGQINRAINAAITERVIPEIQNMISSMSSSGNRDTNASSSPYSQGNADVNNGLKNKITKNDSQSACDLRISRDSSPHSIVDGGTVLQLSIFG